MLVTHLRRQPHHWVSSKTDPACGPSPCRGNEKVGESRATRAPSGWWLRVACGERGAATKLRDARIQHHFPTLRLPALESTGRAYDKRMVPCPLLCMTLDPGVPQAWLGRMWARSLPIGPGPPSCQHGHGCRPGSRWFVLSSVPPLLWIMGAPVRGGLRPLRGVALPPPLVAARLGWSVLS